MIPFPQWKNFLHQSGDVGMVINGERCPDMSFPEGPCRPIHVFLITLQPVTCIPVYYYTFCVMLSLSLGATGRFSDGVAPLK